jgi:hypothetical protein
MLMHVEDNSYHKFGLMPEGEDGIVVLISLLRNLSSDLGLFSRCNDHFLVAPSAAGSC